MNGRFPILSTLSVVFRAGGILLVAFGAYALIRFYDRHGGSRFWEDLSPEASVEVIAGLISILLGVGSATLGEIIGVLFAIERNTRQEKSPGQLGPSAG